MKKTVCALALMTSLQALLLSSAVAQPLKSASAAQESELKPDSKSEIPPSFMALEPSGSNGPKAQKEPVTYFGNTGAISSIESTLPGLARHISSGQESSCAPTHLTVSGTSINQKRFYVSAPLNDFARSVKEGSKGGAKLSRSQAHALDKLLSKAKSASQSGQGFPSDIIDQSSRELGFKVQVQMLCLSTQLKESR